MENHNLHAYGAPAIFRSINCESADKFLFYTCTKCNLRAIGNQKTGFYHCLSCKSREHIVRWLSTYITGLSFDEMYPSGLGHRAVLIPETDPLVLIADEDQMVANQKKKLK